MNRFFDFKAIGFGLAAFAVGYAALALLGSLTLLLQGSFIIKPLWLLFQLCGQILPVGAGYFSAYRSTHDHILNGTIGGALGMLLLAAIGTLMQQPSWYGISMVIASSIMLAALGAVIGNYGKKKTGK